MCELKRIAKRFLSLTLVMAMVAGFLPQITVAAASSGEVTGLSDANIGLSYSGDKTDTWSAGGQYHYRLHTKQQRLRYNTLSIHIEHYQPAQSGGAAVLYL